MNALPQQDDADPSRHPVRCRAHKFGGSSLADAGRIRHVAGLMLDAEDDEQVVVVSAMQGTTDALIGLAEGAARGEDWRPALDAMRRRHLDAADALLDAPADTREWLDAQFAQLAELLRAVGLLRQPGRAFTRPQLMDVAIGEGAIVLERTIDVHIKTLRKKLGGEQEFIETVRGVGYRFRESPA